MRLLLACVLLSLLSPRAVSPQEAAADADVERGVQQVEAGDYDAAIFTLDTAARRLGDDPDKAEILARAYLYLGIAYVGKGHEAAAKAKFRDAILQMRDLSLSAEQFPPKIIDLFEAARSEAGALPPQPEAATATPEAAGGEGAEKGGSKTLLVVGGLAAAGGAVALAAGGGGDSSPSGGGTSPGGTPPEPGGPTTRSFEGRIDNAVFQVDFSSPTYDLFINGEGELRGEINWMIEGGDGRPGALFLVMHDQDFNQEVGRYNQTSVNSGVLQAMVAPLPGAPSQTYHLEAAVVDEGCGNCVFTFVINVTHP